MQTKECPITSDSKHDDLFHKQMNFNWERCYEQLIYQIGNKNKKGIYIINKETSLIKETSKKLNKYNFNKKQVENLIKLTPLNPILQISSITT